MSQESITKIERLNLIATIVGPIVVTGAIAWVGWSLQAKMQIELDARDRVNSETYVNKTLFQSYHEDVSKKLDKISSDQNDLTKDVATIKGELSVKQTK